MKQKLFMLHVIKAVFINPWCSKIHSFFLSMKWKGIIIVGPKTKFLVSSKAKVSINGVLYFNRPWSGRQVYPASFIVAKDGEFIVDDVFIFYSGCDVSVNKGATLHLKSGYMNDGGRIACFDHISIGSGVKMGEEVIIRDSDNHQIIRDGYQKTQGITIMDHVWIGMRAMVLKGVCLQEGTVIAAGSIVNKSIPKCTLAGGVPCKVIQPDVEWN